jgi:allantoin racemase
MRIKLIVAFPADDAALTRRRDQLAPYLAQGVSVECAPVRNSGTTMDSDYESLIFDAYITEAGLRAEDEGFDAVVVDTVSDAGMYALRSRLSIPVVGPGLVGYFLAAMLGRRFSVITPWHRWLYLHHRTLDAYGFTEKCVSVRALDAAGSISPNVAGMTAITARAVMEQDDTYLSRLEEAASAAITDDGADVIVLGSATMDIACAYLRERIPVPVVNPGPAAIKMAEMLVTLGLSQSKVAFATPETLQDEKLFALADGTGATR